MAHHDAVAANSSSSMLHDLVNASSSNHGNVSGHHGGGEHERHCGAQSCLSGNVLPQWRPLPSEISVADRVGRTFAYIAIQAYLFLGMSMVADRFVAAIEVVVSKKRKEKVVSPSGQVEYVQVPIWNETVAHLTLFVLGGCSPEILLSIVETITHGFQTGELGPGTIVGSGCYNLFIITGICIGSVSGRSKRIQELPVFFTTAFFSVFAYAWLYFIVVINTYGIIDVWEALMTLMFFPIVVVSSYLVDRQFFGMCKCCFKESHHGHDNAAVHAKEVKEQREKRFLAIMAAVKSKNPTKSSAELQELAELELLKELPKGRNYYRMQAARQMAGGGELISKEKLREKITHTTTKKQTDPHMQVIAFEPSAYTVMEDAGKCQLKVVRSGENIDNSVSVEYTTKDGTGKDGADYRRTSGRLVFNSGEACKHISVEIIDDDSYKPDTVFFVQLSNPQIESVFNKGKISLSKTDSVATVTKLDDDHGGQFHFISAETEVEDCSGEAKIKVLRSSGAKGTVAIPVRFRAISATPGMHYIDPKINRIVFQDRQVEQIIKFAVIDEGKLDPKAAKIVIELGHPAWTSTNFNTDKMGKPALRDPSTVTVIITENKGLKRIISEIADADVGALVGTTSWSEQFREAFSVQTAEPENEGDEPKKTFYEYFVHIISFFWKLIFAFIPPSDMLGGWAAFLVAFALIGLLTAVIADIAGAIGCTVGLADELTAVTFVSLGTSLPDLFASRIAALREDSADSAIGHVSGANAVNVFLGIGLAWSIAAIKQESDGNKLTINVGSFSFCVTLFFSFACCAILVLFLRRLPPIHGELGGPRFFKILTVCLFWSLWAAYVALVALESYCVIEAF